MSQLMKVHDAVYQRAKDMADGTDLTMKEAVRQMCRDGGHDV